MEEIGRIFNTTKRVIYLRMQEYGIKRRKMIGKNHGSWKGGRVIKTGYWAIWNPKHPRANNVGYVKEHILVMEKYLKRSIRKEEHIHHINFDRLDNDIKNLWLSDNKKHHKAEMSINPLIKKLIERKILGFDKKSGKYFIK